MYSSYPGIAFNILLAVMLSLLIACGKSPSSSNSPPISDLVFSMNNIEHVVVLDAITSISSSDGTSIYKTNFVGSQSGGNLKPLLESDYQISVHFAEMSPDRQSVYIALSPKDDGLRYLLQQNCSLYKISLQDSSATCVLRGNYNSNWDREDAAWAVIKNQSSPLQFDASGNVYILAQKFLKNCSSNCTVGEGANDYQRTLNNRGEGFYLQNQVQVYRIDKQGEKEVFTLAGTSPQAMLVMSEQHLALTTESSGVYSLHLLNQGREIQSLPIVQVDSLLADDNAHLIVNDSYLLTVNADDTVSVATLDNNLRANSKLYLSKDNQVFDVNEALVYQALPFKRRAVAELNSTESPLLFTENYIFENARDDVLIHDTQKYKSFSLLARLGLTGAKVIAGKVYYNDGKLFFVAENSAGTTRELYQLAVAALSKETLSEIDYTSVTLSGVSAEVLDVLRAGNYSSSEFYVNQWHVFPENKHSASLEFSTNIENDMSDIVSLFDENEQLVEHDEVRFGNYVHLLTDIDGKSNNQFVNDQVANQLGLAAGESYRLSVNDGVKSHAGQALVLDSEGITYPESHSITMAPESGVYHSDLSAFYQQYSSIDSTVASSGLLAKPACTTAVCDGFYFNTGVKRAGNVRYEFSSNGQFVQLALWDTYRYAQSYSSEYAPVYSFEADNAVAKLKSITGTLELNFADSGETDLADSRYWRRYRIDFYGSIIEVSYSLDGQNFTLLDSLRIDDADNFVANSTDYFWLMNFEGALDNLAVNLLDASGNVIDAVSAELLNETFDDQIAFVDDTNSENGIGFEENIIASLPLPLVGSGRPDLNYGQQGMGTVPNLTDSYGRLTPEKLAVDDAGNTYLTGQVSNDLGAYLAVWKIDVNGELVTSFGEAGVYVYDVARSQGFDIALNSSGQLYVSGVVIDNTDYDLALWRINADGTLDTTFNAGGLVSYVTADKEIAYSITLDASEDVYLGGYTVDGFTIWKYTSDGILDASFSSDGIFTISSGGNDGVVNAIRLDAGGNVVASGYQKNAEGKFEAIVHKLTPAGVIDKTANLNLMLNMTAEATVSSMAIDSAGNILVFGYYNENNDTNLMLARLKNDFTLDSAFADAGVWLYDSGGFDFSYAIKLDKEGRIYLLSSTRDAFLELIRFSASGELDQSFGRDGSVYKSAYASDIRFVEIAGAEKMLIVGSGIIADGHKDESAMWRMELD